MTDHDDAPELLTTAETARIFRVARSTVISWARRGLLPYGTTPSGHLRFHRDTVRRFLKEGPERPDSPTMQ
ncbi:MAG TPA: helix-turn-helix domain-containing protein [Streptosporangiaceae bacterium]|nr:helix-turn-helix domain-containing protein [Streptosporangiaceae bacterium]